jgi:cytochrome c oxidase assembly protein subunit 15
MSRVLVAGALLLMLAITTSSATIRLSLAGLGCTDWPACFEAARAAGGAAVDVDVARGVHRIAASLAGVWVLAMAVLMWSDTKARGVRAALVGLVALAAGLAVLGVATPSPWPAVTLGNLLGGFAMVGLAAWLGGALAAGRTRAAPFAIGDGRGARQLLGVALAAVFVQAALGALLGAHGGASACASLPGCGEAAATAPLDWRALRPFETPPAERGAPGVRAALEALHLAHRAAAVAVLAAVAAFAIAAVRAGASPAVRRGALAAIVLVIALPALGAAMVAGGYPLRVALAHNLASACLVAVLARAGGCSSDRRRFAIL